MQITRSGGLEVLDVVDIASRWPASVATSRASEYSCNVLNSTAALPRACARSVSTSLAQVDDDRLIAQHPLDQQLTNIDDVVAHDRAGRRRSGPQGPL